MIFDLNMMGSVAQWLPVLGVEVVQEILPWLVRHQRVRWEEHQKVVLAKLHLGRQNPGLAF
jgi:hypothetical protein